MRITKEQRQRIYDKFQGKCAYSGTPLEDDWQVDHMIPLVRLYEYVRDENGKMVLNKNGSGKTRLTGYLNECAAEEDNLVPTQRVINKYKGSLKLEAFRSWFLGGLHKRLAKLPKNPQTEKSIRKKEFLLKVAGYFDITPTKKFSGTFYFEKQKRLSN